MVFRFLAGLALACCVSSAASAATLQFSGYTWQVRTDSGGPGPNRWDPRNAFVDVDGRLHLQIAFRDGEWTCAEVYLSERLGFGRYQFQLVGRPDLYDKYVVLGLFNYPTPDVGPDATNEIDIEFATWGGVQPEHGNWTVWAAASGVSPTSLVHPLALTGGQSTHRFSWSRRQVSYQSLLGLTDADTGEYRHWDYAPADYAQRIPQQPLPVHMNLWLFQGHAPSDAQAVEIIVNAFRFTPDAIFADGFAS